MRTVIRVDFNVPLDDSYNIIDDTKIRERLDLIKSYGEVVLISHLGNPEGVDENLRLDKVRERLEELLKEDVRKVDFDDVEEAEERVLLFENIRFWEGEKENDEEFCKRLGRLGDLYINDAFSVSHREHASVDGVKNHVDYKESDSFRKEKERIEGIKEPYVLILGGKKKDKAESLMDLIDKVDVALVGNLMSENLEDHAKIIKSTGGNSLDEESLRRFEEILEKYETVVWCGPLENYEEGFSETTKRMVEILKGKKVYVCGGDSIASVNRFEHDFELISSGGAFLNCLSSK